MSRSAALLGNVIWIALSVATCLYPCLPARDPNGDVFALSRFDFALIYLASPEALWLQWTAGLPLDYWAVRGTSLAIAVLWVFFLILAGALCLGQSRRHESQGRDSRILLWALRLVLGYSILRGVFFIQEWLLKSESWPITLVVPTTVLMFVAIFVTSYFLRKQSRQQDSIGLLSTQSDTATHSPDLSLNQSWKRRLYGLATLSCLALFTIHAVGAMIPSVDVQVRNQEWVKITHLFKLNIAPNLALPTEEEDASDYRFESLGQLDPVAYLSMLSMPSSVPHRTLERNNSTSLLSVASVYPALLASKLVDVFVGIAGFLLLWGRAREVSGKVPAMVMLMLLLATPATLELGRLGRVEWIATSQIAALIAVSSLRSMPTVVCSKSTITRHWLLISVLSIPLLEWFFSLSLQPTIQEAARIDAVLRFLGFSTLFTIPWVACLLIGLVSSRTRLQITCAGAGVGVFIVMSLICSAPDRSWVPALSFFALPVASGVSWLLNNQHRIFGLIAWCSIIVVSLVNASYWPTMENRLLAPIDWLVSENWFVYGEAQEEVRTGYPIELNKQLSEGALNPDPKLLLLGTLDDIDIPIDCVTIPQTRKITEETIVAWIKRLKVTHVGIVAHPDGSHSEYRALDEADERMIRSVLERLTDEGELQKQAVSPDCFDLTLFRVK